MYRVAEFRGRRYQDGYHAGFCASTLNDYGGYPSGCPAAMIAVDTYQEGYNRGDGSAAARQR